MFADMSINVGSAFLNLPDIQIKEEGCAYAELVLRSHFYLEGARRAWLSFYSYKASALAEIVMGL